MGSLHLYLSCCALMLLLSVRAAAGVPLPYAPSADTLSRCSALSRSLLLNVRELHKSDVMCYAIIDKGLVVRSDSDTVRACAPTLSQNSSCMMVGNSTFSEYECRKNIMKDLVHYSTAIESYLNFPVRSSEERTLLKLTLDTLKSLRENCSLVLDEEKDSSKDEVAKLWGNDTFSNRQEMCKMMRGLYGRTITINRALGYIASSEHRK